MKNLFFLTVFFLLSLTVLAQEKQIIKQDGITAKTECQIKSEKSNMRSWTTLTKNFVTKDINGNHHDLQAYLDQGKPVILDASATWCGPCWKLHQSHILKTLHNTYGPGGTDELVVLFVEAWAGNTLAQITGTSTSKTKNGYTLGDWTDGGTIPYPIIDDAAINYILDFQNFPSVFVICPSGVYKNITDYINKSGNALQEATKIRNMTTSCPSLKPLFGISAPKMETKNTPVSFSADLAVGQGSDLSYAWTFQGGIPESSTASSPTVMWSEKGEYEITLAITNQYGTTTRTKNIIITEPISSYTCDFDSFADFTLDDFAPATTYDGDQLKTYVIENSIDYPNKYYRGSYIVFNPTATTPPLTANSYAANSGTKYLACFAANSGPVTPTTPKLPNNDWFITPKISLKNASKFSFFAKSFTLQFGAERFNVLISTTNSKPESFVKLKLPASESSRIRNTSEELPYIEAPAKWTKFEYDLSEYDNTPVYLAIQCVSKDAMMFMLDDIEVSSVEYNLSVSTDNLIFNVGGGEKNINIKSNVAWTVTSTGGDWLTVDPISGNGDANIKVKAAAYVGTADRTATITVKGDNNVTPKTITIIQSATEIVYSLGVSPGNLAFKADAQGEEHTLEIKSNVNWKASSNQAWLSLSTAEGSDNGKIEVTATANESTEERVAKITISGDNNVETRVVEVKQAGIPIVYELKVNPQTLAYATVGGEKTIEIKSNVNWTVKKDVDWLTISAESGKNNANLIVTAKLNSEVVDRTANLIISGDNNVSPITVSVKQDKGSTSIYYEELSELLIYPNPAKDALYILNAEGANIVITNNIGQVLKEIKSISNNEQIDINKYEAGTYFVRAIKDNKISNRKIVILK